MGWDWPVHHMWNSLTRHWCHLVNMEYTRLNYHVFTWAVGQYGGRIKNWCSRVRSFYCQLQMKRLANIQHPFDTVYVLQDMHIVIQEYYETQLAKYYPVLG